MREQQRMILEQLKRWLGKERARAGRIHAAAKARGDTSEEARAYGEWSAHDTTIQKINGMIQEKKR